MANVNAWESAVSDDELLALGVKQKRRWKPVVLGIAAILGATFVGAVYIPLHRAHSALNTAHQALGKKAQNLGQNLTTLQGKLEAVTKERDELKGRESARESDESATQKRVASAKQDLEIKLDKLMSRKLVTISSEGRAATATFSDAVLFSRNRLSVSRSGASVLCQAVNAVPRDAIEQVRVRALSPDDKVPAVFKKDYPSVRRLSAARAAAVAESLEASCKLDAATVLAVGLGPDSGADKSKTAHVAVDLVMKQGDKD